MAAVSSGPAGQCQKAIDGAVGGRVMSFQSGSAWLNATSLAIIKDVAIALKGCKGYTLDIAGHTDSVGDEGVNRIMSEERAKRVRDALVAKGIAGSAVSAKGYGSSRPIHAGQAADPANRRITFTVNGAGA
jgi:OOP family OmpA-OmpF porin